MIPQEFVSRMVELQHSLLRARGQTACWHVEWPGRLAALLLPGEDQKVLDELKADHAAYLGASSQEAIFWKRLCKRSIMGQARMRQFVSMAQDTDFKPSAALRHVAELTFGGVTGTKMIEDSNKVQRAAESSKNFSKKLSNQRAWSCLIESDLATKVHRFKQVAPEAQLPHGMSGSDLEGLFLCQQKATDPKLRDIVSEQKDGDWFLPVPSTRSSSLRTWHFCDVVCKGRDGRRPEQRVGHLASSTATTWRSLPWAGGARGA